MTESHGGIAERGGEGEGLQEAFGRHGGRPRDIEVVDHHGPGRRLPVRGGCVAEARCWRKREFASVGLVLL